MLLLHRKLDWHLWNVQRKQHRSSERPVQSPPAAGRSGIECTVVDCTVPGPEKGGKSTFRGNFEHRQITPSMQCANEALSCPPPIDSQGGHLCHRPHQLQQNGPWAKREPRRIEMLVKGPARGILNRKKSCNQQNSASQGYQLPPVDPCGGRQSRYFRRRTLPVCPSNRTRAARAPSSVYRF